MDNDQIIYELETIKKLFIESQSGRRHDTYNLDYRILSATEARNKFIDATDRIDNLIKVFKFCERN